MASSRRSFSRLGAGQILAARLRRRDPDPAAADHWQLEENNDPWLLEEDGAGVWLLEEAA